MQDEERRSLPEIAPPRDVRLGKPLSSRISAFGTSKRCGMPHSNMPVSARTASAGAMGFSSRRTWQNLGGMTA